MPILARNNVETENTVNSKSPFLIVLISFTEQLSNVISL